LGFNLGNSSTHITPIFLNDEELTIKFAAYLFHGAGIVTMPFVSPGVQKGKERMRCNVTAAHTDAQIGYTLEAMAEIGTMLGVLSAGTKTGAPKFDQLKWFLQHEMEGVGNAGLPFLRREVKAQSRKLLDKLLG
jgi:hypothetical protein